MLEPLCQAFLHLFDAYMRGTLAPEHRESVAKAWAMVQVRATLKELTNEDN